jgi:uncharacterized short protein YbdD (DUF466 family)
MGGGGLMRALWTHFLEALQSFWRGVRQWSGDSAYEIYLASVGRKCGPEPLSATEFYVEQLNRKYSRPNRCC